MSSIIRPTIFLLTLCAALPFYTLVEANGCFTGGETYAQVSSDPSALASERQTACNVLAGVYEAKDSKPYCSNFPSGNRINWSATNNQGSPQTLSASDCVAAMTIEMNACSTGSKQQHGPFLYVDDPNAGPC